MLLMKDYDEMKQKLQKYDWYHPEDCGEDQGGMYLKAQVIIIGIVTLLCTGGLWLLGNPYFLLLGIVIGLTDALPFIGTGTLLIPTAVYLIFQRKYQLALGYGDCFCDPRGAGISGTEADRRKTRDLSVCDGGSGLCRIVSLRACGGRAWSGIAAFDSGNMYRSIDG